jgi:two-component system, OmpR family, KDP operon response regulator KdpE
MDCSVIEASTASEALAMAKSFTPTLVLTDICLPDMDGIDFVRRVAADRQSIVVVISALSGLDFLIGALDAGADDFVPSPFSVGELQARVRVALRHAGMKREMPRAVFRAGELEVDFRHRRVRMAGKDVHLTPLEYRILLLLIDNVDRVLTYEHLLQAWTSRKDRNLEHIRALIWKLRRKLEIDPARPRLLVNASRIGYQFQLKGR